MAKKYSGLIFLLVAVLCWGPAPVASKLALAQVPEFLFAFLGRFIALLILAALFIPRGFLKIQNRDLPLLVAAGLTGSVFNVGFFVFGLKMTNAMDAQAIFSTVPIMTAIFAYFLLREKINFIQGIGVLVGFVGTTVIATRTFFETGRLVGGNILGDALIFISATSWVGYILISKKLSKKYSPQTITLYSFLVASIVFAPFALFSQITNPVWTQHLTETGILGVFYIGIFASVVAFLAYQSGLKQTSAFLAGVVLYLQPIITAIVATIVLAEKITPPFIVGGALIIVGSVLATQLENVKRVHGHLLRRKTKG